MPSAKPESNIEKAIAYIAKHPGARSPEIAEAIGTPVSNVTALLNGPAQTGYLVVCKVERPGKPPINEYRLSATVAEDKTSWTEFRIANRAKLPLTKAQARPPRNAAPSPAAPPPKAETPPAPEAAAPAPAPATPMKSVRPEYGRTAHVPDTARPQLIKLAPRVVFMVDSTGQLRIEIPDQPPIICTREETDAAGTLLIATEPVWSLTQ